VGQPQQGLLPVANRLVRGRRDVPIIRRPERADFALPAGVKLRE
jgi:hypothetical protein